LVRIPHVQHEKGAMTDDKLRHYLQARASGSPHQAAPGQAWGQVPPVPLTDAPLNPQMLTFLEDVLHQPHDGVKARYRRLGVSGRQGHRQQRYLLDAGWLEGQVIPMGHTRKLILRLPSHARRALGIDAQNNGHTRESIAHSYWKHSYATWLTREGFDVTIEAPCGNGRIDVLGKKDGLSVAIEIETGLSNAIDNVRRCLRERIRYVVVVATDQKALESIEQGLAKARLLLPNRVHLVCAGAPMPVSHDW